MGVVGAGDDAIVWRCHGSGPPLLLINGYAAGRDDWDPAFLEALAASRTVICPDNRGVGDSGPGSGKPSIEAMAADAVRVLDALELNSTAVSGWSMGGYIAQELARAAPDRVQALVLIATDPGGPRAVRRTPDTQSALTDHSGTPREAASRLIGLLFPPAFAREVDDAAGEIVAARLAAIPEQTLLAQESAMASWLAGPDRGPGVGIPAMVVCGTEDVVIPPENSALLAARADGTFLLRMQGGGHALMAQEPQRLAQMICGFLGG